MLASGILKDIFLISGRGTVVLLEEFEGAAEVGDFIEADGKRFEIIGHEMVSFRNAEAAEENRRLKRIGLLVKGATKTDFAERLGRRLQIYERTSSA